MAGKRGRVVSTYLVNHHDGQQIADGSKEQAVQIMLHILADLLAESVEHDLTDDEKANPKRDIAQRPAILQGVRNENHLHDDVDEQLDPVDQIQDDKQAGGIHRPQSRPPLERKQTDGERDDKHAQTRQP